MENVSGFHNKYRPQSLDQVVGNVDVVQKLKGYVDTGKFPSAIGFFGPPSAGKTTLAMALAHDTLGGKLSQDYLYMNMSDNRTIDDVRGLIQHSKLNPVGGVRRFILLDEAQGVLSNSAAAAALLAPLEMPHKKMTWLISSMSPEKFSQTQNGKAMLTRCVQFHLKGYSNLELTKQAKRIIKGEGMDFFGKEAIAEVVKNCNGEMRTLANLLEQFSSRTGGKLTIEEVSTVLNSAIESDDVTVVRFLTAVYAGKFVAAQKEILNAVDYFGLIQKMIYLNYSVLNSTVLNGERHSKVWMTAGAKSLIENLNEALGLDRAAKLRKLSLVQSRLVILKGQAQAFAVPEDMALSAFAYETIKLLAADK